MNVAVAGARQIAPESLAGVTTALRDLLTMLDEVLASLKAGTTARYELAGRYSHENPTLRLLSGLADGADQLAATTLLDLSSACVTHEVAAVLPFDRETYRDRSSIDDKTAYHKLLDRCVWVHELDGCYVADPTHPGATTEEKFFAKRCRARAYRAQSDILLRQSDVLIAISDPGKPGHAGGSREAMLHALTLRLPIIHISLEDAGIRLVETRTELDELPFGTSALGLQEAHDKLVELLAAPYRVSGKHVPGQPAPKPGELSTEERKLFDDYFSPLVPPRNVLHRIWDTVDWLLRKPLTLNAELENPALRPYRIRARDLSGYYSGMYRGAFVLNYSLAVVAVLLAAICLLLALWPSMPGFGSLWLLGILGSLKLGIVTAIYRTTYLANRGRWNEMAVDFRYIAERLRAMNYLPQVGLLRPPMPSAARATRRLAQTSADWLALAIVRNASVECATPNAICALNGLDAIKTRWLANQIAYHRSTAAKMERLSSVLEGASGWLNAAVIAVVLMDLLLLVVVASNFPSAEAGHLAHDLSPIYLFLAAVLPAAVAGANGIRFQSESDRLAERSTVFANILVDVQNQASILQSDVSAAKGTSVDLGSWIGVAAVLAETCAQLFLDEVAEWSVLYAKDLGDA